MKKETRSGVNGSRTKRENDKGNKKDNWIAVEMRGRDEA